jgi:hypothetical protein
VASVLLLLSPEVILNRRTLGILATMVGSAIGAWWLTSQRRSRTTAHLRTARDHGTVIFDNTPTASDAGII